MPKLLAGLFMALAAAGIALPSSARAYDATWHKTDFWAGEYPHGFTLEKDAIIAIRATADPKAGRTISCALKKDATYHPWNDARVAASKLDFVSFVPIVTYRITKPATVILVDEKTEQERKHAFRTGDEWQYLTYFAEGTFRISLKGRTYSADQDLFEASQEKPGKDSGNDREVDEWMKLACANGAAGWLLFSDTQGQPEFASPNILEYGKAADRP